MDADEIGIGVWQLEGKAIKMKKRLLPSRSISGLGGTTIGDFWSWAYSDIMCNTIKSVFAEFLVGHALGLVDSPRIEWDAVDLRYGASTIEVKSSAYIQSWPQSRLSRIVFDISIRQQSWDSLTNTFMTVPARPADCYVFCLYTETNPTAENILDISAWQFYVLSRESIDIEFGNKKSTCLANIQRLCSPVEYSDLRTKIDEVLTSTPQPDSKAIAD